MCRVSGGVCGIREMCAPVAEIPCQGCAPAAAVAIGRSYPFAASVAYAQQGVVRLQCITSLRSGLPT